MAPPSDRSLERRETRGGWLASLISERYKRKRANCWLGHLWADLHFILAHARSEGTPVTLPPARCQPAASSVRLCAVTVRHRRSQDEAPLATLNKSLQRIQPRIPELLDLGNKRASANQPIRRKLHLNVPALRLQKHQSRVCEDLQVLPRPLARDAEPLRDGRDGEGRSVGKPLHHLEPNRVA